MNMTNVITSIRKIARKLRNGTVKLNKLKTKEHLLIIQYKLVVLYSNIFCCNPEGYKI